MPRTQNLCPQQMLRARANGETFVSATMCPQECVLVCQYLQTNSSTPRKVSKRGRKPNSSGLSDSCRICASSFAIHLKIPKVLNGVALVNYNERDNCLAKNLHSMKCYEISFASKKSSAVFGKLELVFRFSN